MCEMLTPCDVRALLGSKYDIGSAREGVFPVLREARAAYIIHLSASINVCRERSHGNMQTSKSVPVYLISPMFLRLRAVSSRLG